MIEAYPHQVELATQAYDILAKNMLVYLACEERTGKTIAALLTAEKCASVKTVLIITKKKARQGWIDTLAGLNLSKVYTVTNYHQAHKQLKPDLVLLDESHNYISAFPKAGKIWRELRPLCSGVPLVYISATPYGQGPQMLFHQFALSSWSPWYKHRNFYEWFKLFGKLYQRQINGIRINQYDRCNTELILGCVDHLFITKTRAELGFKHEPNDKLYYIELHDNTKWAYNELLTHSLVQLKAGELVCDTTSRLRTALHQIEGGTIKLDDNDRAILSNTEKIDFIKRKFGDSSSLVIMYNFVAELTKLSQHFKHATILQATSFAEGIDLSSYDTLVVYSQDYSTSRHTQRRARQANLKRETPIDVHYLLVKDAISEQVYKTVSKNKKNFVDSLFERTKI